MKIIAVLFMISALVIGIVPQFTDCESAGRYLTLDNGRQVSMKCHWTAQGEIALAIPLFLVGGLMLTNRGKENHRMLAILAESWACQRYYCQPYSSVYAPSRK